MRQTLSPDFDAGALVGAVTEFGDVKNLVEIVSAGRFDRRGFLFRREKRIAKRWLLQKVQKIGHIAPTAGAPRRAKAAHDPVRGSFAPELVAFSLDTRHPVDEGAPHWFGDINSFRIAGRERQRFDGLEQRKWDRLLYLQNGRHQGAIGSSNDGACLDRTAQVAVADGLQDRVGELACVARGAERTGAGRVDRHSQAKRMTAAQLPDTLGGFRGETRRGDRRIAFRPRKRAELDVEEVLPVLGRPGRRRRDGAGENKTRAFGESGKKVDPKPGSCQAPGVDVVDHDDCDVLDAAKHRCKLSDGPSLVAKNPAKRRQDCRRGGFHCASRNLQSADALILKARVQR